MRPNFFKILLGLPVFSEFFRSTNVNLEKAAPIYTHFTSPIRRFADIMVHRALAASIGADLTTPDILDKNYINNVCKNINFRNRMAQQAQVIF